MAASKRSTVKSPIHAIKVHQWLTTWDEVEYDAQHFRKRPSSEFYMFSMPAAQLRALCGIYRRSTGGTAARNRDLGIQRRHDATRSAEISEFVSHGFPWSALSKQRQVSGDYDDLKKPGWLPTAIVVNILEPEDDRQGLTLHRNDALKIDEIDDSLASITLPSGFRSSAWQPSGAPPIEVIDGQHRLWAFDEGVADDYELPVVAFHGLDVSWQAYLFYTINIKPKKINTSLAFDLYPLLRTEDWLERFEGTSVYRETRAQELTEALWSYPASPWFERVDMLGDRTKPGVTQAAWVRSLLATFVKSFDGRGVRIGGLFGAAVGEHKVALGWSRPQQAAFLILVWSELETAVADVTESWAVSLREAAGDGTGEGDAAFAGRFSLLNTDQGVRGVLAVANDLCWLATDVLRLYAEESELVGDGTSERAISESLARFRKRHVRRFLKELGAALAKYDWRTAGAPSLTERERSGKARFRGSTGYKELRVDLLRHVAASGGEPAGFAADALDQLGLE
jgi:DGQHR domain-containing protein